MAYFQCKLCKILVPTKFNIWSHLRQKHGVHSTSDKEEKDWELVHLLTDLKVLVNRLTEDDIFEATTPIKLEDISPGESTSSATSTMTFSKAKVIRRSSGRAVKRKRIDDDGFVENPDKTGDMSEDEDIKGDNSRKQIFVGVEDTASDNQWRYECVPCKLKFRLLHHLRRHRWTVHRQKKQDFYCDVEDCDRSFKVKTLLEYHKLTHAPDWDTLSVEEQKKRKWDSRMAVMESRKYKCPDCGKKFIYEAMFHTHCRNHAKERDYLCNTCGASYAHPNSLQTHLQENKCRQKIMEAMSRTFQCEICQSGLKTAKGLQNHKLKQHGIRPASRATLHNCLFCEFVATTPSELVKHNRSHSGDRPHVCEACGQRFAAKHNMQVHVRLHCPAAREKGLDKIMEKEARASKAKWDSLRKNKQHQNIAKYHCPICSMSFPTLSYFNIHRRRHGDKYKCDLCPAGFNNWRSLTQHRGRAHNEQIDGHSCHLCSKNIRALHVLRQHYLRVHLTEPPPNFAPERKIVGRKKKEINSKERPLSSVTSSASAGVDPLAGIGSDLSANEDFNKTHQDTTTFGLVDIGQVAECQSFMDMKINKIKIRRKISCSQQLEAPSSGRDLIEEYKHPYQNLELDSSNKHEDGQQNYSTELIPDLNIVVKSELDIQT